MRPHDDHPHDDLERRLTAALGQRAALAPDAEQVRRAAAATATRRRHRRRTTAVAVTLTVAGLGIATPAVLDRVGPARPPATVTAAGDAPSTGPSTSSSPAPEPSQAPLPWTVPADDSTTGTDDGTDDEDLLRAFTGEGHTVEQALELARLWELPSGYQAAQRAGRLLLDDQPLPVLADGPGGPTAPDDAEGRTDLGDQPLEIAPAVGAFLDAGHDIPDAEQLAALWDLPDPYQAKVAAGSNLLSGQPLPLRP